MTKLVKNLIIGGSSTVVVAGGGTGIALALTGKKSSKAPEQTVTKKSVDEIANAKSQLEELKKELESAKTPEQLKNVEEKVSEWVKNSSHLSSTLEEAAKGIIAEELTKENEFKAAQEFAAMQKAGFTAYNGFHNANINPRPEAPINQIPTPLSLNIPSQVEVKEPKQVAILEATPVFNTVSGQAYVVPTLVEHKEVFSGTSYQAVPKLIEQLTPTIHPQPEARPLIYVPSLTPLISHEAAHARLEEAKLNKLTNSKEVEERLSLEKVQEAIKNGEIDTKAVLERLALDHAKTIAEETNLVNTAAMDAIKVAAEKLAAQNNKQAQGDNEYAQRAASLLEAIKNGNADQSAVLARLAADHARTINQETNLVNTAAMDAIKVAAEKLAAQNNYG